MPTNVDASTITAAQLFTNSTFVIPDFQREYSWGPDGEVMDFWRDLSENLDSGPYFLGLLIVTDEKEKRVVVDGQQRLTTLTLLANAVRKAAANRDKNLVADSMRDVFLFNLDYETEERSLKVEPTAGRDRDTLKYLLEGGAIPRDANKLLLTAQKSLDDELAADLDENEPGARLAKWARYLSNGLTFALFEHPNRNSAYKVYEVVNTRGRDLTPAELIKSYLIGGIAEAERQAVYDRWSALENSFVQVSASGQFTQFVRHVVTLNHGYVIPRDLYQKITEEYVGAPGVELLLCELESHIEIYLEMVDPSADELPGDDAVITSFSILNNVGLRTVRPIFLAAADLDHPDEAVRQLIRVVVPRLVMGTFGTGSVERRFADDAARIHGGEAWEVVVGQLATDLAPSKENFCRRILDASLPKGLLAIIRASILTSTTLPIVSGYLHQIRPANAESWPDFDDLEFKQVGGTIGNTLFLTQERRPRNTNTLVGAVERLFPAKSSLEDPYIEPNISQFTASSVVAINEEFAQRAGEIWYDLS